MSQSHMSQSHGAQVADDDSGDDEKCRLLQTVGEEFAEAKMMDALAVAAHDKRSGIFAKSFLQLSIFSFQLLDTLKKLLPPYNPFLITSQRRLDYFIILLHRFWECLLLFQPLMQKIVINLVSDITSFVSNSTNDSLFLQPEQPRSSICGCQARQVLYFCRRCSFSSLC